MKKAFTLVEMLVAIILLSLLIGIAVFSFKMQLISIHKTKKTGLTKIIEYTQLKSVLESIKFYVVDDFDVVNRPMKSPHLFFQGNEKSMLFITTNPIFTQKDALVKLQCQNGSLLYKEEPLFFKMNYLQPDFTDAFRTKIFYKNAQECSFSYKKNDLQKTNIVNSIPDAIEIKIKGKSVNSHIYSLVKSDENGIVRRVKDAIYENEE